MQTISRTMLKLLVALLLVAGLFGTGHASAASLPTSPCVSAAGSATCELWATTGAATLFGSTTVNIWGYSTSSSAGTATLPGPVLIVNQGDAVTVTLHNGLTEPTALYFQGQSILPDTTGVAAGGTTSYSFVASHPGTFLYEAGLIPGKQHQAGMGMYGALVVKPSDGTAYGSTATAYDEEALLVLSEFDTSLAAAPTTFDMRNYAPKYFLINGKAYAAPFTGDITVTPGNRVLLRYVNAGLQSHAMSTLGISQKAIAQDGYALAHPHSMVAETIATGQTLDALVTIPATTALDTRFAIYDANLLLRNNNASTMGGMLTFLKSGSTGVGGGGPDTTGPSVTSTGLSPNPTNGSSAVTVSATINDVASGNSPVAAAEFYIDSTAGSPTAMTAVDSLFDTSTESVTGTISTSVLAVLASTNHPIYVRGQDALGNWGPFVSVVLNLDKTGPATSGLSLTPNPSSGAVSVALTATGNDTATGNNNVTVAEYWVDGGVHTAMTAVGSAAPTRNFTATIPSGLSMGTHVVSVRSQDVLGNWGAVATINLQVADVVGPATSGVTAAPNPNNGSTPLSTSVQAVRVTANFSDVATGNSNVVAAEGFIDTVGTTGTGFVFIANDGLFNNPTESGYSDIPLAVVGTLTAGNHTIYVHAKDAAGNWGGMATTVLVIDKTPPTVVSINRLNASPTNANSVQWQVTFSEGVTGVTASNFSLVENLSGSTTITSVSGSGAIWTVTATTGNNSGTIGLNLTSPTGIKDLVGNAMTSAGLPFVGQVYTIDRTRPTITSINRAGTNPTNAASVQFTVTFSEAVVGGTTSNFSLTTSGVTGASITSVTGSGSTRTVTVNTGSGSGSIRLNMANSTGVTDLAGNTVNGLPYTSGQTYTIDKTAPTVSSINRNNTNPTTASSVSFTVTFSESVTGGANSNFALTTTGTYSVAPSITSVTGTGTTRTVTINTGTNSGGGTHTIRLDMVNSTGVADLAGNAVSNLPFTTGQSYTKN